MYQKTVTNVLLAVCRTSPEGIGALCGAMLLANIFLGTSNSSTVQPVVGQQRSILYRCLVTHLDANAFWLQTHMHMHGARASQAHCMTHMHHVHMQHMPHMHHMHIAYCIMHNAHAHAHAWRANHVCIWKAKSGIGCT